MSIPTSRFGRSMRLAAAGARAGLSLLGKGSKESGGAAYAAEVLGNLRGLAAKVGQMASYVDGVLPEAHRESYEAALGKLRNATTTTPFPEVRAALQLSLGRDLEALFAEFDEVPCASASMGQVHRARLHSGEEVAVKVQHPRIREAVLADLGNASVLEGLANLTFGKKYQAKELLEVVRTRFLEELDYSLERERMDIFRALHAGDPQIRIPRVFPQCSSDTVLTTAFVRGMSFEEACAAPLPVRTDFARTLWRFVFRGNLVGGKFNADPHPGNYFFHEDGGVTFIDFGCVQELPEAFHHGAVAWHHAAIARDEQAFANGVCATMQTRGGELERRAVAFCRACFEPLFGSPFHMTRAFSAGLVELAKEMTRAAHQADADEFVMMPPELLFMNRLQFGFYSILARLDVPVDYAAEEQKFLPALP